MRMNLPQLSFDCQVENQNSHPAETLKKFNWAIVLKGIRHLLIYLLFSMVVPQLWKLIPLENRHGWAFSKKYHLPASTLTIRVTFKRLSVLIFQLNLTASLLPIIAMLGWAGIKGLGGRPRGVFLCEKTCSSSLAFGESDKKPFPLSSSINSISLVPIASWMGDVKEETATFINLSCTSGGDFGAFHFNLKESHRAPLPCANMSEKCPDKWEFFLVQKDVVLKLSLV